MSETVNVTEKQVNSTETIPSVRKSRLKGAAKVISAIVVTGSSYVGLANGQALPVLGIDSLLEHLPLPIRLPRKLF